MLAKLPNPVKGLSSLIEPVYAPGHVLMDDDLTAGVAYTRNLSRLLFRSLFGCGVICGFGVLPKVECGKLRITVKPGVALDCCGDPVEMHASEPLTIGDNCGEQAPPELWVMIRRRQHACAPRELACPSDDEDDACGCHATRLRAGYELRVVDKKPCGVCACDAPDPPAQDKPPEKPTGERAPEEPTLAPQQPVIPLSRTLGQVERAQIDLLIARRNDINARVAAATKGLIGAGADVRAGEARVASLNDAIKKFEAEPEPKDKKGAEARARQREALTGQLKESRAALADAHTRVSELQSQRDKDTDEAGEIENDYNVALSRAGADAPLIHRLAVDPSSLIARPRCHQDHYAGVCSCCCDGECDGWVVLAKVKSPKDLADLKDPPTVDYSVRRFIRPVLAADPYWDNPPTADA